MPALLKDIVEVFFGRGKVDIRRRLLRLILFGSILTFALMSVLSMIGVIATWSVLNERGAELSESAAEYIEQFAENQARLHMLMTVESKARHIRADMQSIGIDVKYIAAQMHRILSEPQNYPPIALPDPRVQSIDTGEIYVFRSRALDQNRNPAVENEIALASNIANSLKVIANDFYEGYQASLLIGSRHDYIVCVDIDVGDTHPVVFTEEFMNDFVPSERPWYRAAINAGDLTYTDLYISADGYPTIDCVTPYYDAEGIAGVVSIGCNIDSLYNVTVEEGARSNEVNFIVDRAGYVLLSSQHNGIFEAGTDRNLAEYKNLSTLINRMKAGEKGVELVEIHGKEYFIAFAPINIEGWSLGTMVATEDVIAPAKVARRNIERQMDDFKDSIGNLFAVLTIIALILLSRLLYVMVRSGAEVAGNFVKPIQELTDGVREIAGGNFDKKLRIRTGDEIEHLAVCFNAMTDELQKYMANLAKVSADKERIATELDVATEIQASMLPRDFDFGRSEFELYATMHAAKEVGGDFYDFYLLDDDRLVVTIADVSGKGVAAALFMVISRTIMKNFAMTMTGSSDVGALVACTNQQLCQNNDAMMFVTMFVGVLDLKTGRFTYVNGGHNPPLVYRASEDRFRYLNGSARNYALGLMDAAEYEQETIDLSAGDVIYLYTDGVTEALNESEELYGDDRLEECLNRTSTGRLSVEEILAAVRKSLDEYVGAADQSDDITMIGLKYRGGAHD